MVNSKLASPVVVGMTSRPHGPLLSIGNSLPAQSDAAESPRKPASMTSNVDAALPVFDLQPFLSGARQQLTYLKFDDATRSDWPRLPLKSRARMAMTQSSFPHGRFKCGGWQGGTRPGHRLMPAQDRLLRGSRPPRPAQVACCQQPRSERMQQPARTVWTVIAASERADNLNHLW